MAKIIVAGNPIDGLEFHGPFDSAELAGEWGEDVLGGTEFWIADLGKVGSELETDV